MLVFTLIVNVFKKKGYNTSQMFFHLHSSEDQEVGMHGMTNLNLFGFLHYVPSLNTLGSKM